MRDDQLLANLRERYDRDYADQLEVTGITTYRRFFALVADDTANDTLRIPAFTAIHQLGKLIDKRRVISPLLAALKSSNERIVCDAIQTLGYLRSRRAAPILIKLLDDRSQPQHIR